MKSIKDKWNLCLSREKENVCKCSKIDKNLGALHTSSTQIALKSL